MTAKFCTEEEIEDYFGADNTPLTMPIDESEGGQE